MDNELTMLELIARTTGKGFIITLQTSLEIPDHLLLGLWETSKQVSFQKKRRIVLRTPISREEFQSSHDSLAVLEYYLIQLEDAYKTIVDNDLLNTIGDMI